LPHFIDRHDQAHTGTPEETALAHVRDLDVEIKHGVHFLTYWMEDSGNGYCLVEAPAKEAAVACHVEAHGEMGVPAEILDVSAEDVLRYLGQVYEPNRGEVWKDSAFRALVCVAVDDTEGLTRRLGDTEALRVLRILKRVMIYELINRGGREVTQLSDGMLGCFRSVVASVECALGIRRALAEYSEANGEEVVIRIGIAAGEPVTDHGEIFGASVQLAKSLCEAARTGRILVPATVRDLCLGKGIEFSAGEETALRGFGAPMQLFEVLEREPVLARAAVTRPADPKQVNPDRLSSRELEVLGLIAEGKTNQEIADTLVISVNTVLRHVSNIFGKAGLANRAEAAGYAYRHNMA
jgi:class 3 adenylate cyclase/DNA-binding CsgD family transcriptional regulator